jgi:phosphohistidine swiveling domain-containing protein
MYTHPLDGRLTEPIAGSKAFHLGKMAQAGYPVPDGFVVLSHAFAEFSALERVNDGFRQELKAALDRVKAIRYMVRSSAIGEDGIEASFAGQLESFQSGPDTQEVIDNIQKCWSSYRKDSVGIYEASRGVKLQGMAVVVQRLIEPSHAGVIFTRNPDDDTEALVEYVEGHGEKLVSGKVNPGRFTYSLNGASGKKPIPLHFDEGIRIARSLERMYQMPLDIEWVMADQRFYVVQSRPITTIARGRRVFWSNTNINENYPDPVTPLLYSIARDSYYNYFKQLSKLFLVPVERIRALEPAYTNVIGTFGCRVYYNMSSIHEIIRSSPFSSTLIKSFDNFVGYAADTASGTSATGSKLKFLQKVVLYNSTLDRTVGDFERLADQYSNTADAALSYSEMRDCFHAFIQIRMHSWYKASLADFFAMLYHGVLGKFCKKFYGKDADGIHNNLIQAIPGLISSEPVIDMYAIKTALREDTTAYEHFRTLTPHEFYQWLQTTQSHETIKTKIAGYISKWGFRCSGELMLTTKTYCEEPAKFIELLKQYDLMPDSDPAAVIRSRFNERKKVINSFRRRIVARNGILLPLSFVQVAILHLLIHLASRGIMARERVRLKQALLYFKFKQIVERLGSAFRQRGFINQAPDILFLRHQEIAEMLSASYMLPGNLKEAISLRQTEFEHAGTLKYPDDFSSPLGEYPSPSALNGHASVMTGRILKGLPVCGGQVRGKAKVLTSVLEASRLVKGDILVTRQTDPGWIVVFPLISGLIVERGGMLSHGAIVSREFGIPAIVGVQDAHRHIKDGEEILLNADTGEISIL